VPEPRIVPVNYVLDGEAPVSRTGWSVVVRGALAEVTGRRIRIPDDLPFTWWG
jgi:hypothetical protein